MSTEFLAIANLCSARAIELNAGAVGAPGGYSADTGASNLEARGAPGMANRTTEYFPGSSQGLRNLRSLS